MKLLDDDREELFAVFLRENKNRMSMKLRVVFPFVDALIVNVDVSP